MAVAPTESAAALEAELDAMVNRQFETPEFTELFALRFTLPRARLLIISMAQYVCNRRDCWAYVQGGAPLDVKRIIWEHEREELVFDPRAGMDHYTLALREAQVLGLTPEDFDSAEPIPGARAAFYAWIHLAKSLPWIEGITASSILERRNSDAVVKGGGFSFRVRQKLVGDLGIPEAQLINQNVHVEADQEHPALLGGVLERYAAAPDTRSAVLRAARESLEIDRAFRGAQAQAMARLG